MVLTSQSSLIADNLKFVVQYIQYLKNTINYCETILTTYHTLNFLEIKNIIIGFTFFLKTGNYLSIY